PESRYGARPSAHHPTRGSAVERAGRIGDRCNCRGNGWHEHRYLVLPDDSAWAPGGFVVVEAEEGPWGRRRS
ncbi:MAG: hypothetical protein JXR77_04985, partial [Lentisphaeria bacterium]|nr:hypothetical protein [Lentisphaeria bacterium]